MSISKLNDWLKVRPNTGLPLSFMNENIVVCTGEDSRELMHAMSTVLPLHRWRYHEYRCYRAWAAEDLTIILSGIGSGCLEPLMFELLDRATLGARVPKRLVMIGTAGYLSDSGFGQVYLVEGAYPVGCAVALDDSMLPVRPSFAGLDRLPLPRAEEISTDYYYACTVQESDPRKMLAKALNPALREGLVKYWQRGRLISMETAQFYHFARHYGPEGTEYVALRGVANLADQFETQGDLSVAVLTDALRNAASLLQVDHSESLPETASSLNGPSVCI